MSFAYTGLDLGMTGEYLSIDGMFPKRGPIDITDEVNRRIFPDIPKGSQVVHKHASVVGKQGSGKSVLMNYMAHTAMKKYGPENMNTVYTNDLRVAFDMMDGRPVQLYFVDDAMTNASSREISEQTELVKTFNSQRHVFEDKLHGRPGVIINIFGWQRWIELDPAFRDGNVSIFKTGMAQARERRIIEEFIGKFYYDQLQENWDRQDKGNNAVKSRSVARISARDIRKGGAGFYNHEVVENVLPPLILSKDYFGTTEEDIDAILEKLSDRPGWEKMVQCYRLHILEGRTQTETARELGVRQGYVSESKKKVEGELKKKK